MTASVLLHPRWIEPVMFLYDNSLDEINKNMDGFHAGSNFAAAAAANPCRNLMAHPAPLAAPSAAAYTSSEAPAAGMAEPAVKQCSPCSAAVQSSSGAALPYGYFGSGYYPCRMTHHNAIKSCAQPASTFADKYMDTSVSGEEFTSRAKEFAFYQGYAAGPYQPVPGYLDMPVVPAIGGPGEPRHDPLLPMDSYQPWAITNGWNGQVYCPKEQSQPPHLWKSTLPGNTPAWLPLPARPPPPPPPPSSSSSSPARPSRVSRRQGSGITPGLTLPRPARAPRPQPAPARTCPGAAGAAPVPPPAPRRRTAHPASPARPRRRHRERKQLRRAAGRSAVLFSMKPGARRPGKWLQPRSVLPGVPRRAPRGLLLLFVCLTEASRSVPKSCLAAARKEEAQVLSQALVS